MKKKLALFCLLTVLLLTPKIFAQCTSGIQYPIGTYQATTEAGTGIINSDAKTGQYTNVHVLPSKQYTFSTSVATDYITVTNSSGTQVYASGVTPVAYVTDYNESVRYYIHQNAQCETTNQFNRSRTITWVAAPPCIDPIPTGVSNITPISCTISLTEPNVTPYFGYEAYVSTSSVTPPFTVPTSDSMTGSIFVTNLNPDTTYHYWLRSDCLYQKGDWIYGGTFSTIFSLLCNSAYYGLYPTATFTPTCTGEDEIFSVDSQNGSFSNIAIVPNTQYTFRTDYGLDFITITNSLGTVVLASGTDEVIWNSGGNSGVVRFYSHDNAQCGYGITGTRAKFVKCVTTSATCLPPTNLAVSNITSNSCQLAWTAPSTVPSSGYEVYLVTNNVAPGVTTVATLTSATAGIGVVNGLTAGVTYYYWIRSNCGSDKSSWASGGSFTVNTSSSCNVATYGQWPAATFTPNCSGTTEQIIVNAYASEYSKVNILANNQYTFSSSVPTDFITISNEAGNVILASGNTPLSWSSGTNSGVARYYLHTDSNCGAQNTDRIKSIQCTATSSCGLPSALTVSNITSNSCRLTWNAPTPAANSYDIYVSTSNTAPIAGTTATQTSNGNIVGSLNGLSASTTYYYWGRSNCNGSKSAWVSGGSFTTIAALSCNGAIYGLYPEATFTPTCSPNSEQIATDAWAGEYSNVNVLTNKQYTFTSSIATDYITVTNATGTTVLASGLTPLSWSSGTTSGVVRYHLNTNSSCGSQNASRIKSIQCTASTSCGLPTALSVSNITSNSCRLNWTAPATTPASYDIYVVTTNTAPINTTTPTANSVNAGVGVLNGLTASTIYYYWIRSNCNDTKSDWVSGGSFMTIATLNCNGAIYGLYPNATFTPACTGSTEQITTAAYAGEYTNVNILSNKQYTFTSSIATDYITITNATGTTLLASGVTPLVWNSTTSGVIRYHINTNANCGDQNSNRVRSITCQNASSCNPPEQFVSEVTSSTSAVIVWAPSTSAPNGGYLYVYNTSPTIGGMDGSTFSTSADLTDLAPNTTYYWWVAANCVSSQSNWAFGGSFTTLQGGSCNPPTQFWTDGITATTAAIGWVPPTNTPDSYIYTYNTTNQIGGIQDSTASTSAFLENLTPNTDYHWWVASVCGEEQTAWTYGGVFNTLQGGSCNPPTQFWTDGITATTATIGWVPPTNTPDSYIYTYNTTNQIGGIQDSTVSTSALLENLTPNTDYHWWVASVCGEEQTAWTYGGVFNTLQGNPTYCFEKVSGGLDYTIAIKSDGTLWAWGKNTYGQLGDGTTIDKSTPVQIGISSDWMEISCGLNHNMALKTNGTLWSWGRNLYGQLGDGTTVNKTVPTQVGTENNWVSVTTKHHHNLGIKSNGTLWSWGQNLYGQVGDGNNGVLGVAAPTQVGTATNWQSAATGNSHSLAIKTDGTLWGWGNNINGQLGNGIYNDNITPLQIGTATNWRSVDAGYDFTIATKTNNTLWSCGANTYGELGLNTTTMNINTFTQVGTATTWDSIFCGRSHVLASRTYGALFAWGYNNYGQIGNGTTTNVYAPTLLLNVTSWIAIANGFYHSLAIDNNGSLYTWGYNSSGQLGNGSTVNDTYIFGTIACPTNNLSVDDFTKSEMKFYPNPVNDILNISFEHEISNVSIYNLLGQEVLAKTFNSNEISLDMSNFASGSYLVKVNAGNVVKTIKIIKL